MDALEADIARTRQDLAHTVDLLAAKLDMKTRIRNRVAETREAATAQAQTARTYLVGVDGKPTPAVMSVGGGMFAALAAVVLVRLWMRPSRRHNRGGGVDAEDRQRIGLPTIAGANGCPGPHAVRKGIPTSTA